MIFSLPPTDPMVLGGSLGTSVQRLVTQIHNSSLLIPNSYTMAKQDVAQLFRAAQRDQSLRQELSESPDLESFVHKAKYRGFDFTVEEWKEVTQFVVEEIDGELSEIPGL